MLTKDTCVLLLPTVKQQKGQVMYMCKGCKHLENGRCTFGGGCSIAPKKNMFWIPKGRFNPFNNSVMQKTR